MIKKISEIDSKDKIIWHAAAYLIYIRWNPLAQELLDKTEWKGLIDMDNPTADPTHTKLVANIIFVIAKDSATERVRREVDLLTNIQKFQRSVNE